MKSFLYFFIFLIALNSCNTKQKQIHVKAEDPELHRPEFHFSPPSQWMNDPNGMVFYGSNYHLFYQHYPDSNVWGPMHWGHAISKDLIHWEHKPIALYPDEIGYIFSGSAVSDTDNTSGLGTAENPPLIAIFTYHDPKGEKAGKIDFQTQGIAYSIDSGKSWAKYEGNPVLKNPGIRDFRDPKVVWYEPGNKWIMVLAVSDHVSFYSSPDLINWKHECDFGKNIGAHGGVWECPDMFQLEDQSGTKKWILLVSLNPGGPNGGSGTQYFTGEFNGNSFIPEDSLTRWLDYGTDNYAGVTWSNVSDRKLFIGWMSNWQYATIVPTIAWRSAMTLPRTLNLVNFSNQYYVTSMPVEEFDTSKKQVFEQKNKTITEPLVMNDLSAIDNGLFEINLSFEKLQDFNLLVGNDIGEKIIVGFDTNHNRYFIDRTNSGEIDFHNEFGAVHYAPRLSAKEELSIRLIFDVASVELFADNGLTVMTDIFFPSEKYSQVQLIPNEKLDFKDLNISQITLK